MFANTAILAFTGLVGLAAAQYTTPGVFATTLLPGNGTVVSVTKVYTAYTTVCPGPTSFEFNGHTYDVTEACTLTITDCPCTVVETHGGSKATATLGWGSGSTGTPKEQPYICTGDDCDSGSGSGSHTGSETGGSSETPGVVTAGAGAVKISLGLAAVVAVLAL